MSLFARDTSETTGQKISRYALGVGLTTMGALHFKRDKVPSFASIVPPWVPGSAEQVVYASGLAELGLGLGLLTTPGARRITGLGAAALFVAVYPANIYQYTHKIDIPGVLDSDAKRLRRLPFQLPLIAAGLYVARRAR